MYPRSVRRPIGQVRRSILAAALVVCGGYVLAYGYAAARPVLTDAGVLPEGSVVQTLRLRVPRQILTVLRRGGEQSYLVALGNMAFSAPGLLGGTARRAGISCESCHTAGARNSKFFVPGVSAYPGSADVTSRLFNPEAADGLANPIDIPSLRGIRFTAPYGHDGRFASLRAFVRNVIVNEFNGPEPSPLILDALVAYMRQFAFLPNPRLTPSGWLTDKASAAAHRGQRLFRNPFEAMGGRSCASCHTPDAQFTDGQQHVVGTGQAYETPTLLNINYTAPYFADGSARTLAAVIEHFNEYYGLGLSEQQRSDLLAYLHAVGGGKNPYEPVDFEFALKEVMVFAGTLPHSIEARRAQLIRLTVNTINAELRDIRERWQRPQDRGIRSIIANWVLQLRRVDTLAAHGKWQKALTAYRRWRDLVEKQKSRVAAAESRSLYNPENRADYLRRFDIMLSP